MTPNLDPRVLPGFHTRLVAVAAGTLAVALLVVGAAAGVWVGWAAAVLFVGGHLALGFGFARYGSVCLAMFWIAVPWIGGMIAFAAMIIMFLGVLLGRPAARRLASAARPSLSPSPEPK